MCQRRVKPVILATLKKKILFPYREVLFEYADGFSGINDLSENSEAVIYGEVLSVSILLERMGFVGRIWRLRFTVPEGIFIPETL